MNELYLLVEWHYGEPSIDGALYFNEKSELRKYYEELPKVLGIEYTICTIKNGITPQNK